MSRNNPKKSSKAKPKNIETGKAKYQEPIPAHRDTFVHYLFGTPGNEPILLHFINAVLESDHQPFAASVEMRNPFNPQTFITEKYTILDVRATDERGDIFVVEFQTTERKTFADRMTYYGCRAFGSQLLGGESYSSLNAVMAIAVTTFVMFRKLKSAHNTFRLTAKADPSVVLTELLQLHVLEAAEGKIDRAVDLPSALCAWLNFFYYSHLKSEVEMSTLLKDQPIVKQAYKKFQQFNQDERLRAVDEARQRWLHDQATDIEEAQVRTKVETKVEIARNMKRKGYTTDDIAEMTGLSSTEIKRLDSTPAQQEPAKTKTRSRKPT